MLAVLGFLFYIQATIQGFEAKGFSKEEGATLLRRSVELAREARDIYYDKCSKDSFDIMRDERYRRRPILIAASVGSYGAYLADGSEYTLVNLKYIIFVITLSN